MAFEPLSCKILGLGGAGTNVIDRLADNGASHADLIAANTDLQSLTGSVAGTKIQLGKRVTRGLGAGGDPELGYAAAEEALDHVREAISGAGVVFLCVGLGGGTGSGAAPLLVQAARESGAFTIVFATMPFQFEGRRRMQQAEDALAEIQNRAHAVVCFENDRMGEGLSPQAGIHEAFATADEIVSQSLLAMSSMVNRESLIQLGFDEVLSVLQQPRGRCLFGFGLADSDNRASEALQRALENPLMDRGRLLAEAAHLIVQVTGGAGMTLYEVQNLMGELSQLVGEQTHLMFGLGVDEGMGDALSVMLFTSVTPWRRDEGGPEDSTPPGAPRYLPQRTAVHQPPQRPAVSQPEPGLRRPASISGPLVPREMREGPVSAPTDHFDDQTRRDLEDDAFEALNQPPQGVPDTRDRKPPAVQSAPVSQPMSTLARITQRVQASMGMIRSNLQQNAQPGGMPSAGHGTAGGLRDPRRPASPQAVSQARRSPHHPSEAEAQNAVPAASVRDDEEEESFAPEPACESPADMAAGSLEPEDDAMPEVRRGMRERVESEADVPEPGDERPPIVRKRDPVEEPHAQMPPPPPPRRISPPRPASGHGTEAGAARRTQLGENEQLPVRSTRIAPVRPQARVIGPSAGPVAPAAAEPERPASQRDKDPPKQTMLEFDQVNRGRFEKSEPTIVDGEDLDVPTFMRHKGGAS